MEYVLLFVIASGGAAMSFYTGFGFGTVLFPIMAWFFDIQTAIVMTAVVHFLNSLFKLFLVGRYAHWPTVWAFGIPSAIGAFVGVQALRFLSEWNENIAYSFVGMNLSTSALTISVGMVMLLFAVFEYTDKLNILTTKNSSMITGGLLSGFFGGVCGQQGAMRSAFLMHRFEDKKAFLGTRTILALIVDSVRITSYLAFLNLVFQANNLTPLYIAISAGFTGAFVGNKFLHKVSIGWLRKAVMLLLLVMGVLLIFNGNAIH